MNSTLEQTVCYHCGAACEPEAFKKEEKSFCCYGCQVVFELIEENGLCEYYSLESYPGLKTPTISNNEYDFLNENTFRKKILEFDSANFARVRLELPAIHCSSCIWLLENLHKAQSGIFRSEVNFGRKEVCIDFDPSRTTLASIASLLATFGYPPRLSSDSKPERRSNSPFVKMGIAGFVFGNVMLFSFPEYLGLDSSDAMLGRIFSFLNLGLSIPVIVYCASDYFRSASKVFSQRQINIDVPIALGLAALFGRSTYDIVSATGPGYLDSLTGLVFFLLIGKWFQNRMYEGLSFERDFKSYFPLAVQRVDDSGKHPTAIFDLRKGDTILIRNLEIVPADSVLLSKISFIDYSFVTGESRPVKAEPGSLVYAGGRLIGEPATFRVTTETKQSHLTSLWNSEVFRKKHESRHRRIIDTSARIFTWSVMGLAAITTVYWQLVEPQRLWLVLTSVLMVACPCTLALAAPFAYGNMLRVFGRNNFYLKNADVVERLASVNSVVFDKTGTLTHGRMPLISLEGDLTAEDLVVIKQLTGYSTHPLSRLINQFISGETEVAITSFKEIPGKGIEGVINDRTYRIGSAPFTGFREKLSDDASLVFVSIDEEIKGYFRIEAVVRNGVQSMIHRLGTRCAALLSGDSSADSPLLKSLFPATTALRFNQRPMDKMQFISDIQSRGAKVLMVGDGLNDAGGLKQADVGIAVTDDTGLFTPGCDGILQGDRVQHLDKFMSLAASTVRIVRVAFAISFLYNAVALSFAISGHLTPLVAAILMPMSSITVVAFSTLAVAVVSRNMFSIQSNNAC